MLRKNKIGVALSDIELKIIEKRAKAAGVSKAEYLRLSGCRKDK